MKDMQLQKENIQYEQCLGEGFSDIVVNREYLIPDTHPDVKKVLMLDIETYITSQEAMNHNISIEGKIKYNLIYLSDDNEEASISNVVYSDTFRENIEMEDVDSQVRCEGRCIVEHMDFNLINERKVEINGIIKIKETAFKSHTVDIVSEIDSEEAIQLLKSPIEVDRETKGLSAEVVLKGKIDIPDENLGISKIIKSHIIIHKKEINITKDGVQISAFARAGVFYKGNTEREIVYVEEDVYFNKEFQIEHMGSQISALVDFSIESTDFRIDEEGAGGIDFEVIVGIVPKIIYKESVNILEDAYCTGFLMDIHRKNYSLSLIQGTGSNEIAIRESIQPDGGSVPDAILISSGDVLLTEKRIVEGKVVIDGVVKYTVLFKNQEGDICSQSDEIPFTHSVDIDGAKIHMNCHAEVFLEEFQAFVEVGAITVKAVLTVRTRVYYSIDKEFVIDIVKSDDQILSRKSSVTIYTVQTADTLWKIAKKYGTTIEDILSVNLIENPDIIYPGDKLILPGRAVF